MKIIVLFILLIGIILLVSGYLELYFKSKEISTEVEYRFVTRNVYDHLDSTNLEHQFSYMFDATDARNNTNMI